MDRTIRLSRSASAILSGGAAVAVRHEGEAQEETARTGSEVLLTRQQSRRQVDSDAVQTRLREEAFANLLRQQGPVLIAAVVVSCLLLISGIVGIYLLFNAMWAATFYADKPCDQEWLGNYIWVSLITGSLASRLSREVLQMAQSWTSSRRTIMVISSLLSSVPGYIVVFWGYSMVNSCKTCQQTDPELFYPTEKYIYFQVFLMLVMFVIAVPARIYAHHFLLAVRGLDAGEGIRGCAEAIKELPKIANDSEELVDSEDGQVMECSICLCSFQASGAVVKTPCCHYFHEKCLSQWCNAHVSCPLCKCLIADPGQP
eukprot:gb/GFBE01055795.1/.p1 GENE.gb/GFBE01055795.1/~~gb/GFBE01055795.1/.p1  ORF type:complete len:315 (+),score=58.20 gb/GFBE01055795.1/:1-945(+)